jgi:hypothetical protein
MVIAGSPDWAALAGYFAEHQETGIIAAERSQPKLNTPFGDTSAIQDLLAADRATSKDDTPDAVDDGPIARTRVKTLPSPWMPVRDARVKRKSQRQGCLSRRSPSRRIRL